MVLISGYEEIRSRAFYHINFQVQGRDFSIDEGVEDPQRALKIIDELKSRGYDPQISRTISYGATKSGFLTKPSEYEDLTTERLEEIVSSNESLPIHREPIIVPWTHGADIGD